MAETIRTSRWFEIPAKDWSYLPEKAGVYTVSLQCCFTTGKIETDHFYIGSSVNLKHRFREHASSQNGLLKGRLGGSWSDCVINFSLSRKHGDWAMRELRLIHRLQPSMNIKNLGVRHGK